MNFNTILYRFGLDPDNFINEDNEPIKTDNGYIYDVRQRTDNRTCPKCLKNNCTINDYRFIEINCSQNAYIKDILRVKKVRFYCHNCHTTFTPILSGIQAKKHISNQTISLIVSDFYKVLSFEAIAQTYGLTRGRVIQLFDEQIGFVPRKPLPKVLCIDEKKFGDSSESKYCCILYDYENGDVVDVIRSRQLAYLKEYFDKISETERENVHFFVSDMFDGFDTICRSYFPKATHIIDMFHITRLLTSAVNSLRVVAMNKMDKKSICYKFMKKHWKQFLKRSEDISDSSFSTKDNSWPVHFDELVSRCIKSDIQLLEGYNILQDFYHYHLKRNYKEALEFVEYISSRLKQSEYRPLIEAGASFHKWRFGIANTISRSQNKIHYSNSLAENTNNHIETIIRVSYGYCNFERFRKRVLLIRTYKTKNNLDLHPGYSTFDLTASV